MIVDLGASPFIMSCALKYMGYKVVAVDPDPAEYATLALQCGVDLVKADLERDRLNIPDEYADCAILAEILEHLNPYYVSHAMSEVNRGPSKNCSKKSNQAEYIENTSISTAQTHSKLENADNSDR